MVSVSSKDIIFGIIETSGGLATAVSIVIAMTPCAKVSYTVMIIYGCLCGYVPLLMRWTLKFWQGGTLSKAPELIICIWAAVCYLIGAAMIIVCINDTGNGGTLPYIPACFALIVAVITLVDMIIGLL